MGSSFHHHHHRRGDLNRNHHTGHDKDVDGQRTTADQNKFLFAKQRSSNVGDKIHTHTLTQMR